MTIVLFWTMPERSGALLSFIAARVRCKRYHSVLYDTLSIRFSWLAEMPFLHSS